MHLQSLKNISTPFVAALLALPITLYTYGDTGVVLADVVSIIGILMFLRRAITLEALFLTASIVFAFSAIVMSLSTEAGSPLRQIGSLIFFFKPCFSYFTGFLIIKYKGDLKVFLSSFSLIAFFVMLSLFSSIIYSHGGIVRGESEINGSIFGLTPFGAYGVNSLATYFATCSFVGLFALSTATTKKEKFLHLSCVLGFAYLTIFSLSREATLGLFTMYGFLFISIYAKRPILFLIIIIILLSSFIALLPILEKSEQFDAKVSQIEVGLASGDWDYLSSGRLSLYQAAFKQIADSPVMGAAFTGYDSTLHEIFSIEDSEGLSPHNQYITAIWKMGIPSGLFYFAMIAAMISRARKIFNINYKRWFFAFLLGFLLIFANLWDVLIIPNVGALFFFILGAFSAVNCRLEKHKLVHPRLNLSLSDFSENTVK